MSPLEIDFLHFALFNTEDQKIECHRPKYEVEKEKTEAFKKYLQCQDGCDNWYPYTWHEISEFANSFLNNSEDIKATQEVLDVLEALEPKIKEIKEIFGLQIHDLQQLKDIEYDGVIPKYSDVVANFIGINNNPLLKADNWDLQADIDCALLHNRIS